MMRGKGRGVGLKLLSDCWVLYVFLYRRRRSSLYFFPFCFLLTGRFLFPLPLSFSPFPLIFQYRCFYPDTDLPCCALRRDSRQPFSPAVMFMPYALTRTYHLDICSTTPPTLSHISLSSGGPKLCHRRHPSGVSRLLAWSKGSSSRSRYIRHRAGARSQVEK